LLNLRTFLRKVTSKQNKETLKEKIINLKQILIDEN